MVKIQVDGMSCGHCAATVKKAIASVDPEALVEVDLTAGEVRVDGAAEPAALRRAIEEAGYTPLS